MTTTSRFNNSLGKEYHLFQKAIPNHDELQKTIGKIVKKYLVKNNLSTATVFEGGVGTGITTAVLLKENPRSIVVGVDNEPKMLRFAKKSLPLYQDRLFLHQDDLLSYLQKQPASTFDVFVSVWVIHNLSPQYRKKLFKELHRTLKPGGLFINGDKYARDGKREHSDDLEKQIKLFDIFTTIDRPDLKIAWTKHYLEDDKIKITEAEQKNILKKLGFVNVRINYRKGMEAIFTAVKME